MEFESIMKVGDLLQCVDNMECGGPLSTGLVCEIQNVIVADYPGSTEFVEEVRYWAVWNDGQYAWVTDREEPEVISEGG